MAERAGALHHSVGDVVHPFEDLVVTAIDLAQVDTSLFVLDDGFQLDGRQIVHLNRGIHQAFSAIGAFDDDFDLMGHTGLLGFGCRCLGGRCRFDGDLKRCHDGFVRLGTHGLSNPISEMFQKSNGALMPDTRLRPIMPVRPTSGKRPTGLQRRAPDRTHNPPPGRF